MRHYLISENVDNYYLNCQTNGHKVMNISPWPIFVYFSDKSDTTQTTDTEEEGVFGYEKSSKFLFFK